MCKLTSPCKPANSNLGHRINIQGDWRRESGREDLQKCDYPIQGWAVNCKITQSPRGGGLCGSTRRSRRREASGRTLVSSPPICCCWMAFYDEGGSIRSIAQMGRALPPAEIMGDLSGGVLGRHEGGALEGRRGE